MLFLGGQPTVWVSNGDPQFFNERYPDGVPLGSRAILQLGEGGRAGVVQIGASDALSNNMKAKRERIADLGVSISSEKAVERTATEIAVQVLINNAALASSARNLSAALTAALRHAARFAGAPDDEVSFELDITKAVRDITLEERQQNLAELEAGILSKTEVRSHLERAGKTSLADDVAFVEIEQDRNGEFDNGADERGAPPGSAGDHTD